MKTTHSGKRAATLLTRLRASVCLAAALALAPAADAWCAGLTAPAGMSITGAYGKNIDVYGVEAHWDSLCPSTWLKDHNLDTRLSAQLAYWHSRRAGDPHASLVDVSLTPLLRWWAKRDGAVGAFVEGGIGVHLISRTQIDQQQMSTAAQFGERIAAGLTFGPGQRYEASVFAQHVSNGRIKQPNNGITFFGVFLGMQL